MRTFYQSREQADAFLQALAKQQELWAPVQQDLVRWQTVRSLSEVHLEKNAWFPLKEFFFAKREQLFLFIGQEAKEPERDSTKRVFFGVRKCDLNAVAKQDRVYLHDVPDPYYASRRENATLIGYHCATAPSEFCFCGSMDLKDHFDLMYYDRKPLDGQEGFLVEVGSEKGRKLLDRHKKHFAPFHRALRQDERKVHGTDRLSTTDLKDLYTNPGWQKGVGLCLSCGACTTLCPTCYCFEIHDEPQLDGSASRERTWSSCMLPGFTRVAGDHVFRSEREHRFKHRIYHQLDYYNDRYGENLCVGCGRCIDGCPTRIDFVSIINGMEASK